MFRFAKAIFISVLAVALCVDASFALSEPVKTLKNPKHVALTFDDGPSRHTDALLAMLKSKNVKATFFMNGVYIANRPGDVAKVYADGHLVQSHALTHKDLTKMSYKDVLHELSETNDRIENITGERPRYLRPPYGFANDNVMKACLEEGMIPVNWSNDSHDYVNGITTQRIEGYVIRQRKPSDIILMHQKTVDVIKALPAIIEIYRKEGYEFVTIEEL